MLDIKMVLMKGSIKVFNYKCRVLVLIFKDNLVLFFWNIVN